MDEPWVEKYRPKTLDEIVGQDEIVKRLKKYVEKKSMPHLLFSGPPGVGKCLTGDTKVIVNGEVREIGEVVEEISNGKFGATLTDNIKVLGVDEEGKVREFNVQYVYKDKTNALIKIKTKMGRELKVTTYHPLLINNKNGEIKWEKAENLKVGDKLATPRYVVFDNNNGKDIENIDLVRWIAYYVAEGYIKDDKIIFTHNDKKIINKFLELTKSLFKDAKIIEGDNCITIISKEALEVIKKYNLANKRIPNNVMNSDTLKVFLDAYIECEGIKKDNKIILPTTNKDFAEELSYALLRYGVIVKLEKVNNIVKLEKVNNIYKITIFEEISDKIIVDVKKINYICEKLGIKNVKLKSNILGYNECKKLCNAILNKINNKNEIEDDKLLDCIGYLLFLASNEIYWDEIVEIEQLYGDFIIYDLHVPKYHNFVGGNLPTILHNTTAALCLARDLFGENWRENFLELNASVSKDTPILVKINGVTKRTTFAELDKIYFKEEDEEYKDVDNLEVLTVDDNYKVRWAKVSKIIRHKVEKILKVYLEGGAVLELTGNHAIMMLSENGLITKKASDIKVGDFLLSFTANIEGDLENINSNISTLITKNKRISDIIYQMPIDKRIKYLKELFDCKGKLDIIKVPTISKDLSIDIVWLSRISGFESYMNKIILKNNLKKSDLLPADIVIKLLKKIEDKINGNWRYVLRHQLYEKKERVSKILIREILKMINKEELSEEELNIYYLLHKLAYTDLHALKVKKIEIIDYNDYVYDVSVPNNEMFFAGNVPILLHNSDERGIDVIRTKVKEFARTKPIGDIPFKIIFLDESDALTADAQNALRRIMEKYSNVCRFILSCNYPSKIIPPIQSRCAVFRFSPLKKEDIAKKLKEIAEKENLKLTESGLDAIIYVSEGDLRKAINVLQTAAALSNVIDDEIIYKVSSRARPEEVKKMMELALEGKFMEARDLLYKLMVEWGMSGEDILNQMFREINNLNIDERKKVELADYIGETDFRIVEGANERIQLSSLLAKMALLGKK
ncbi:replication factor C small subunit [Methanocaldococcus sp.]